MAHVRRDFPSGYTVRILFLLLHVPHTSTTFFNCSTRLMNRSFSISVVCCCSIVVGNLQSKPRSDNSSVCFFDSRWTLSTVLRLYFSRILCAQIRSCRSSSVGSVPSALRSVINGIDKCPYLALNLRHCSTRSANVQNGTFRVQTKTD